MSVNRTSPEQQALQKLEEKGEALMKDMKAAKSLFRFAQEFQNGIESDQGRDSPSVEALRKHAHEKLEKLNIKDNDLAKAATEELYGRPASEKAPVLYGRRLRQP